MVVILPNFARGSMGEKPIPVNFAQPPTDNYISWSTSNNIYQQPVEAPKLHYNHYAVMYVDESGIVRTETSQSLLKYERLLFPEETKAYFEECSRGRAFSPPPHEISHKRSRIPESIAPKLEDCTWGFDDFSDDSTTKVPLEIGDTEKVLAYYESALRAFQQINCRQIAKAYIKIIEPRKQVKFPYNGDHLKKPERIRLLIHIFRNLRQSRGINVDKLEEAGLDAVRQIKPSDRLNILKEIYMVRRLEEEYEDGCRDGSTIVYVCNRDVLRAEKDEGCSDIYNRLNDESSITAKIESDYEPASKYLRMSVPQHENAIWSPFTSLRNASQVSMSTTRSRPSFQMDFESQVSSLPDDESETATPLDYGPVSVPSAIDGQEMQTNLPRFNSWSSSSTNMHNPYFTTTDYQQSPGPIISHPLMIPGTYLPDLNAATPCQTRT
ncbi:hypothetical protein KEM56_001247 [Ascosphaera pollenicola]|nr:hypothetical protein KEM56_001247 [Ascosphaera pollenicola]